MGNTKLVGVFINTAKADCSIYESGRMIYNSLILSNKYDLDYVEVDEKNRNISNKYDFYAFNYHHFTMGWLDTKFVRHLPGIKITFVLETLPNNPFILCSSKDFDVYCVLDPTMNIADKRVYSFSRPLEIPPRLTPYNEHSIPVIGSFGFATAGKGFELVVDAVNKEFEQAIVRINIPFGTYTDIAQNYAEYLSTLCKKTAKKGIQVIISHDYLTKEELIDWCGQNTLNCFLYNRDMPGLSATTDQAISSGRPLAVSENNTFRHIIAYIKPYPYRSLKESIAISQAEVLQIRNDWAPANFAKRFEQVLDDFNLSSSRRNRQKEEEMIELKCKQPPKWYRVMLKKLFSKINIH